MRIEDIEKLSLEDLERISEDESVKIPEGFGERIEDRIMAAELASPGKNRKPVHQWRSFAAVTALAASVAIFAIGIEQYRVQRTPLDTFDSPEEAYAQVEKTFALISSRVEKGKHIADNIVSTKN